MAQDYAGLKGIAQVVPVSQGSNLYAFSRLAQQKQLADQALAEKQKQADIDWYSGEAKLGFPTVRNELQQGLGEVFRNSYQGMADINRNTGSGNHTQGSRQAIMDIKNNYDRFAGMVQSFNNDLSNIENQVKADKDKGFNQAAFSSKLKGIINEAFIRNENGAVVGINPKASSKASDLLSDPDIYDDGLRAKMYVDKLGKIGVDQIQNQGSALVSSEQSYTNGLYETNPNGTVKISDQTGKPIPKASGEAVYLFDSDPVDKAKLDKWAQSITPDGKNWEQYRGDAFKRFVVDKFANYQNKKSITANPAYDKGNAQDEIDAQGRYTDTIRPAVFNNDESALAQTFSASDRIKAEYSYANGPVKPGTQSKPQAITILRRETMPADIYNPNPSKQFAKYTEWTPFETIPLSTDKDKEKAIFKLNDLLDEAGPTNKKIGQDRMRKVHEGFKKTKQVDLGF